jgi:hypothetical protein
MKQEEADKLLPDKPTQAVTDPTHLNYFLLGPPKWGKTSFACDAPKSILLATEQGHSFHSTTKLIIDCWDYKSREERTERAWAKDSDGNTHTSMVLAAEALESSSKYDFIIIDTADMAAKMCSDFHLDKRGVEHASDAGDWGKGWEVTLAKPFREVFNKLAKSGRGMCFISHLKWIEKQKKGVTIVARWESTLPSAVQHLLHTQADVILHAKFGKKRKGMRERDRIFVLDGSDDILAGSRVRGVRLPMQYIVDPEHPWKQFANFFEDEESVIKAEKEFLKAEAGPDGQAKVEETATESGKRSK